MMLFTRAIILMTIRSFPFQQKGSVGILPTECGRHSVACLSKSGGQDVRGT
jgi:hypothetical protein